MLRVAITGNIGSGKSTITKIFQAMGIPVFVADVEARFLYAEEDVRQEVIELLGKDVYDGSEVLNKKRLAEIIFNDPAALQGINNIIHPRTLKKYQDWLSLHKHLHYTVHESAILFENNLQHHFDKTIVVTAPQEVRIKRVEVLKKDFTSL